MNTRTILRIPTLLLLALAWPVRAGETIYRCVALDGTPIFQGQPCNEVAGTREARDGSAGVRLPVAPPPAEEGAVAAERYRRYLEQLDRERREQAAADHATAERLRAEAQAAAAEQEVERASACDDPYVIEADARCRDQARPPAGFYPVYVPLRPRPPVVVIPAPPVVAPLPGEGSRPTRPPPRLPRDPRAEILDTRR